MNTKPPEITLLSLFLKFLKIGSTSFGGFMALISVVQDELVEKKRLILNETILDGISLASILPGPMAVNVVTYVGYNLRGIKGALVSMFAVILPSFLVVYFFSWLYFAYGDLPVLSSIFQGITPAVSAIILSVAINMAKKNINQVTQWLIMIFAGITLILVSGIMATLGIILFGGLVGYLFFGGINPSQKTAKNTLTKKGTPYSLITWQPVFWTLVLTILIILVFILLPFITTGDLKARFQTLHDLLITFGSMSITLFGGGYVIIPIMNKIIVENLGWLTQQEFIDGIALGQVTPGPIMISATFIGYKVAGFWGSIVATLAIFFPPGFIMIVGSKIMNNIKNSPRVVAVFMGLRPAVIGMILSAVYTIGKTASFHWGSLIIFFIVLLLLIRFRVSVIILIPLSGLLGYLIF